MTSLQPLRTARIAPVSVERDPRFGVPGDKLLVVEAIRILPVSVLADPDRPVSLARYRNIDRALLNRIMPDVIVAPLFGATFDVLDLLERLERLGFTGRLVAVTPPIPNAGVVLAEVRAHAKRIAVALVEFEERTRENWERPKLRQVIG
jgi:hypothetical protein